MLTDREITEFLFLEDGDQRGDLALVFGNRYWRDPLAKGIELYKKGLVPKILFSGGVNDSTGEQEAENMYAEALKLGLPKEDLYLENQATSTLENVLFAKKLIEEKIGWDKVKTVCGVMVNAHARRALMTMKKHFPPNVVLKACPYVFSGLPVTKDNWPEFERARKLVERELNKIETYLAKGDIAVL